MITKWLVDGQALFTRTRSGGANALKGFEFQKAYAQLRLVWLLTGKNGVVEVRYEGAQDIDIRYGNGEQEFVQAKDYAWGKLTKAAIYDALAGFTRDLIHARKQGSPEEKFLRFTLTSTTPPIDKKSLELYRNVYPHEHAPQIAKRIAKKYRYGLDDQSTKNTVYDAMARTDFEVSSTGTSCADLEAIASWELVKFGVPVDLASATLSHIGDLLKARASMQVEDVAAVLLGLPSQHPANANSPCRLLPSRSVLLDEVQAKIHFLKGALPSLWAAIANNLDVRRSIQSKIEQKLLALALTGGMLVIEGAAGTGKSTLARRVVWDLHRKGIFIALHAAFPASLTDESWQAIVKLSVVSERPILILVDDVWRQTSFIERLDQNVRKHLCVLATSRPGEQGQIQPLQLIPENLTLSNLEPHEFEKLCDLLGASSNSAAKDGALKVLIDTGQIFSVSLILQSGSLKDFATRLIMPLRELYTPHWDGFIDLCVCGMHDHTVPKRILARRLGNASEFWKNPKFSDLMFDAGEHNDRLRVGHALIGASVIDVAEVPAVKVALSICSDCDIEDPEERRFALRLISNLTVDENWLNSCLVYKRDIIAFTQRILPIASYTELNRIIYIMEKLKCTEEAEQTKKLLIGERVKGGPDVWLAMTQANKENFHDLFEGTLTFYQRDPTAYAKRKFLLAVMTFGSIEAKQATAEHMSLWLRQKSFPPQETRIFFDLCTYTSQESSKKHSWLVGKYSQEQVITMETSLAAIRILERAKDETNFFQLEARLVIELRLPQDAPLVAMEVAIQLTNTRQRLKKQSVQPDLCDVLMNMYIEAPTRILRARLLKSAILLAPQDQGERLRPLVAEIGRSSRSQKAKNCLGLFAKKFSIPMSDIIEK
ncbi:hypothetical protein BKM15_00730 [Pseudomonas syringae pv. syringae]|nr:hypothetical protein BKM15_00730 [Pseudomonas syringae pv. syringae]